MTNKELKRLRRQDLLEILVAYGDRIESLTGKLTTAEQTIAQQHELIEQSKLLAREIETYRERLSEAEAKVAALEKKLSECDSNLKKEGSIARAALMVYDVFENAQKAADKYIEGIKRRQQETELACLKLESEARSRSEQMLQEAEQRCKAMAAASSGETAAEEASPQNAE